MEIYKDLKQPANQEFEKLLNSQLSKNKLKKANNRRKNYKNYRKICFYIYSRT